MKRNAIVRIILFSIAILLLLSMLVAVLTFRSLSFSPFSLKTFSGSAQMDADGGNLASVGAVSAESVKNIRVEWVSGSITVQPGDVTQITFSETEGVPEEQRMVWKQSGDTLIIQYSKPHVSIGFFGSQELSGKELVVTVPRDWQCSSLEIDSVSASIKVSSITAQTMELVNVSGKCSFAACSAASFDAETVSGNVEFEGSVQNMSFSTVSANCTATISGSPREIEMNSVSGDLRLTLPDITGFTASMDSTSGDPDIDFPVTASHNTYTFGDGSCRITADSVSGDLTIGK